MDDNVSSKVRRKTPLDRAQIIALLLVVSLVLNAIVHFTHPAYRYYKQSIDTLQNSLDKRYTDYERNVATNIVPAILFVATNNLNTIEQVINGKIMTGEIANGKSGGTSKDRRVIGHSFRCGEDTGFWSDDICYFVGDDYNGEVILRIGKNSFSTIGGLYILERPKPSGSFVEHKEVNSNV